MNYCKINIIKLRKFTFSKKNNPAFELTEENIDGVVNYIALGLNKLRKEYERKQELEREKLINRWKGMGLL